MKHFPFCTETTTPTPTPTTTPGKAEIYLVRILKISIHFIADISSNCVISMYMYLSLSNHNISAYLYLACIDHPACQKLGSFCGNLIIQKQCRLTCGLCGE